MKLALDPLITLLRGALLHLAYLSKSVQMNREAAPYLYGEFRVFCLLKVRRKLLHVLAERLSIRITI